jgi:hypothetical protein
MKKNPGKKRKEWLLILFLLVPFCVIVSLLLSYVRNEFFRDEIEGLPSQVSENLTQEDIDRLEERDFPIHYGFNPPNIEGTYLTDSTRVDYDDDNLLEVNTKIMDYRRKYFNQTEKLELSIEEISIKDNQKRNASGYISGEGSCFTIFDIGKTTHAYGCVDTSANIISGCLDEDGNITDFRKAILMLKHNSKLLCTTIPKRRNEHRPIPVGNTRLISERDGLAEKVD